MIGGGPAGLMAATESARKGLHVAVIDKGIIGNDCSAVGAKQIAGSGYWSNDDNYKHHLEDTLTSGCYINDIILTTLFTKKVGTAISRMEEMGMPFTRNSDGTAPDVSGNAPGHSKGRSLRFSDITGKLLVDTLLERCRCAGIPLYSETPAIELVKSEDGICGAIVLDYKKGNLYFIRAKAVVLATGGLGRMYNLTSNPVQITGDGVALAIRAGAKVADMEFVQFYPVTVIAPASIRGMNLNCQYYGAKLVNAKGERFMSKYFPEQMEATTRDKLARSIAQEIRKGNGTLNGGVYIDASPLSPDLYKQKIPTEWDLAIKAGIDPTKQLIEVAPAAHYFMGGISIDTLGKTSIPHLFAAGECCAGIQGANRLANNGLAEAITFGFLVGEGAASYAKEANFAKCSITCIENKVEKIMNDFSPDGWLPRELSKEVRQIVSDELGVLRDADGLQKAKESLEKLLRIKLNNNFGLPCDPGMMEYIGAKNMLTNARIIAHSAYIRQESRGAHYRLDYPAQDDNQWLANLIVYQDEAGRINSEKSLTGTKGTREW